MFFGVSIHRTLCLKATEIDQFPKSFPSKDGRFAGMVFTLLSFTNITG